MAMLLSPGDLQILVRLEGGMTQSQIGNDLGLEQPAVSKAIRAAEQRLGMTLVHADGRRLKLTSAGREVARAAAGVLMQVKAVDDLIVSLRAGRMKHTRIVASSTPGTYLLPRIVAEFLQQDTDAQIDVEVVSMPKIWDEFVSGAYDIAFTPRLPFTGGVRVEQVYVDPVRFFTAPAHHLAARPAVSLDDLQAEQLVGKFSEAYWGRFHYDLRERGWPLSQSIDLSSAEAVKRIVASGVGVGVLFESTLKPEFERGELVALPVAEVTYEQTYFLVRSAVDSTPQAERLCAFIRDELARVCLT
jgi:LysR family transcriptional regulator, regulator for metE and metH